MIFKFMEKTPKIHDFAIKENNTKSVWELSKVITRQHFSEREEDF